MGKDNEVTVDEIRAIAEQIARERNVTISEVTTREVKNIMKRGSDGYIGAHLQTIKIEHARAQRLAEKQTSAQYNAALYDEITRHAANAREVALAEAAVTQQMFDDICESNNELEKDLTAQRQENERLGAEHDQRIGELEKALHAAKLEQKTFAGRYTEAQDARDRAMETISTLQASLANATARLEQVEAERDQQAKTIASIENRLAASDSDLKQEQEALHAAKQNAELLTWKNERLQEEIEALKTKVDAEVKRAAESEAALNAMKSSNTKNQRSSRSSRSSKT